MTPEQLREKITFKKTEGHRPGFIFLTGSLIKSFTITYDDNLTPPPDIEERIKDRIMHDIYGDWQRKVLKAYQQIFLHVLPMSEGLIEAELNFIEALNIKIHQNQEHDDTRTKS